MTSQRRARRKRAPIIATGEWLNDDLVVDEHLGGSRKVDLYLCYSRSLEGLVACKVLRPEYRIDFSSLQAVMEEGEILEKMRHPHVVEGYGFVLEPHPTITMEHLPGLTIRSAFLSGNYEVFDVDDIVDVALQTAEALSYVHRQGYLHLDVKPSNLMYYDGHVTLYDFSIAEPYSPDKSLYDNAGTRDYMAPEQTHRRRVGYATDVFGLGVVFYELLAAGKLPYPVFEEPDPDEEGETRKLLDYSHPPAPPSSLNPAVSKALDEVALAAIAPEPELRPATPDEFRLALLRAADRRDAS
ncbi:MAG: serine/threonine protein kinase [Chloroflexi bacterium]|nr:serine/threonine protein kinase [Chloroflexota bacterium]